jgi:hypothetical protein
MFNHFPYNHTPFVGNNVGEALGTPPVFPTSLITAVAQIESGMAQPKFVIGGTGGTYGDTAKLFKIGTTHSYSMWRSKRYTIGAPFNVASIAFSLTGAIAADMLIIPVLNFDDGATLAEGLPIDLAHYPDGDSAVTLTPATFNYVTHGEKNVALELHFRGEALIGVQLPIVIDIETESQG